jgi:hypothetical protein
MIFSGQMDNNPQWTDEDTYSRTQSDVKPHHYEKIARATAF